MNTLTKTGVALVAPEVAAAAVAVDLVKHGAQAGFDHNRSLAEDRAMDREQITAIHNMSDDGAALAAAAAYRDGKQADADVHRFKSRKWVAAGLAVVTAVVTAAVVIDRTENRVDKAGRDAAKAAGKILMALPPKPLVELQAQSLMSSVRLNGDWPLTHAPGESTSIMKTATHVGPISVGKIFNSYTEVTIANEMQTLIQEGGISLEAVKSTPPAPSAGGIEGTSQTTPAPNATVSSTPETSLSATSTTVPTEDQYHVKVRVNADLVKVQRVGEYTEHVESHDGKGSQVGAVLGDDKQTGTKVQIVTSIAQRNEERECGQILMGLNTAATEHRVVELLDTVQQLYDSVPASEQALVDQKLPDRDKILDELRTNPMEVEYYTINPTTYEFTVVPANTMPVPVPEFYTGKQVAERIGMDENEVNLSTGQANGKCTTEGDFVSNFSAIIKNSTAIDVGSLDPATAQTAAIDKGIEAYTAKQQAAKELATSGAGN
ncbi:MAG: hypothetical protein JWM81_898 [Candidatus Saccharibacteria bacterium]|nr:hypothetical protein [Candidatus Saccharibacteria bacterium]